MVDESFQKQVAEEFARIESMRSKPNWQFYLAIGGALSTAMIMFFDFRVEMEKNSTEFRQEINHLKQDVSEIKNTVFKIGDRISENGMGDRKPSLKI